MRRLPRQVLEQTASTTAREEACPMCKGAMNKAAAERQIDVTYTDGSGTKWKASQCRRE